MQMCAGLAAAHAAGLVHRDVKPQNLLLGTDGVLKLGDFGVAVGHEGTRLTLAGTVLGTAGYLAPEQARGEQVTAAADIYAVGAVLYELLTGEPSRTAGSLAELGSEDGFEPPDLAARVPGTPPELVAAVTSCLSARPEDRPPTAAALARLLAPVASEAETLVPAARPRAARNRDPRATRRTADAVAGSAPGRRRRPGGSCRRRPRRGRRSDQRRRKRLPTGDRPRIAWRRRRPGRTSPTRHATSRSGCGNTAAETRLAVTKR